MANKRRALDHGCRRDEAIANNLGQSNRKGRRDQKWRSHAENTNPTVETQAQYWSWPSESLSQELMSKKDGIFISQAKYLKYLLKRFGLENCTLVGTSMVTRCKLLSKDESPRALQIYDWRIAIFDIY